MSPDEARHLLRQWQNIQVCIQAYQASFGEPKAKKYFSQLHVKWQFNLEKSPRPGSIFECMNISARRCLRKSVGRNCLSYDELLTLITEIEVVLNSRPLTYVSSKDVEEPLTPTSRIEDPHAP